MIAAAAFSPRSNDTRENKCMTKRTVLRFFLLIIGISLTLSGGLLNTSHAQQSVPVSEDGFACIRDWSEAGRLVDEHRLLRPEDVRRDLAGDDDGQLLRLTLCRDGGQFHYQATVLNGDGVVESLSIDAQEPD